mgnify:CR=1 FL=1
MKKEFTAKTLDEAKAMAAAIRFIQYGILTAPICNYIMIVLSYHGDLRHPQVTRRNNP